jgi:hypothetical protein
VETVVPAGVRRNRRVYNFVINRLKAGTTQQTVLPSVVPWPVFPRRTLGFPTARPVMETAVGELAPRSRGYFRLIPAAMDGRSIRAGYGNHERLRDRTVLVRLYGPAGPSCLEQRLIPSPARRSVGSVVGQPIHSPCGTFNKLIPYEPCACKLIRVSSSDKRSNDLKNHAQPQLERNVGYQQQSR